MSPFPLILGILEVLHCVLVESPEALNIIKEGHIKSIISLLDKHGRNHKVRKRPHVSATPITVRVLIRALIQTSQDVMELRQSCMRATKRISFSARFIFK